MLARTMYIREHRWLLPRQMLRVSHAKWDMQQDACFLFRHHCNLGHLFPSRQHVDAQETQNQERSWLLLRLGVYFLDLNTYQISFSKEGVQNQQLSGVDFCDLSIQGPDGQGRSR